MKILAYIVLVPLIAVNASKCSSKKPKNDNTTTTTTSTPKDTTATTVTSTTSTPSGEGAAGMNNPPADSIQNAIHGGTQTGTDPVENYRVTISFASRGSGIDHATQATFLKWMGEFQPHVVYEETHWGREGEVDYCLKLSELSTKDQERFVKEARSQLGNKDLIFLKENTPCAHKR